MGSLRSEKAYINSILNKELNIKIMDLDSIF